MLSWLPEWGLIYHEVSFYCLFLNNKLKLQLSKVASIVGCIPQKQMLR